ncbi:protein trichome birefringence-like 12 isoform X2 [Actinidia eriantha]|uniref:protein trichome birefringence-like 12 isoform X2 n=1 Tax=Actinidia eriantha TaxID=165200 RepID=UPI00258B61B0|nr:protein trichome birefringence-like 12 isoform X2 [Actinidia eriantha]
MAPKLSPPLFTWLILLTLSLIFLYSKILFLYPSSPTKPHPPIPCNLFNGHWASDPDRIPIYDKTCPFHRNAWNCLRNQRDNMGRINSWKWVPEKCELPRIDPLGFLGLMRNKRIGFVGDSLNENFLASFLCVLRVGDLGAKKWKRKGAWRGAFFPKFNVTVAYHRAVLLAKYEWGYDKFPKEKPLVFYKAGRPIVPPLQMLDGLKVVLDNMVSYIQKEFPKSTLKFWRLQSPRHFYGGEWNQNGSCLFNEPLEELQLDLWFDPSNNGVNKEARQLNRLIEEALQGTDIQLLDLTHLSEFRADAHPAIWLGKKDAVAIWGQDCMHWCLPGVPDTWVDILSQLIRYNFETGR